MERQRQRDVARSLIGGKRENPDVRRRWTQTNKLLRYGLTRELFDGLLAAQGNACGMCRTPFGEDQPVFIDHDHACCPAERTSCGRCVRGLLCLSCNTALGHIERKYELARAYLDSPPARSSWQAGRQVA
jgi:Recombination endonuclease VII